jgi:hypothetical protein
LRDGGIIDDFSVQRRHGVAVCPFQRGDIVSRIPSRRGWPSFPIPQVFLAFGCALFATSCGPSAKQEEKKQAANIFDSSRCEDLLNTALNQLKPQRLNIDSDRRSTVETLNQWASNCGTPDVKSHQVDPAVVEMIAKVTGSQQMEHFNDKPYSGRDGLHVRTCFLAKRISEFAGAKTQNDLDRVVDLFEYVVRNIDLELQDPKFPPNTLYAALFFGAGTPEDRAWAFASILRQIHLDAVILRPKSAAGGQPDPRRWLVGVPLDGEVYLFDTRLGTPVPAADDDGMSVTVRKPATLAAVKEHDELFRALDLPEGRAYPLHAEDMKDLSVEVVGEISFWLPRTERLQLALSGANSAIIYDPLEDREGNPGALRRVAEAGKGHWDAAAVTLWPHPEAAIEMFESRSEEQSKAFVLKDLPFRTPFKFVPSGGNVVAIPESEHQRARVSQLIGDFAAAIANYNNSLIVQNIENVAGARPEHKVSHFFAADNATFWTGVIHLEQNDPDAALNTLRKYKRKAQLFKISGPWMYLCHGLIAQILASQGKYDEALQELAGVPKTDPKRDSYDLLARRWKKHVEPAGTADKPETDSKAASNPEARASAAADTPRLPGDDSPVTAPRPSSAH